MLLSNKSCGVCVKYIICVGVWSLLGVSGAVKEMFSLKEKGRHLVI